MKTPIPGIIHFCLEELVAPGMVNDYGPRAIQFLDKSMVFCMDRLSGDVGGIIINNYHTGGTFSESGVREPDTKTGARRSIHKSGGAFDGKPLKLTPAQLYDHINKNRARYPEITCIEDVSKTVTWLHMDNRWHTYNGILIVQP